MPLPEREGLRPIVPLSPARRRVVTAGVLLGLALGALEATVVGTAMPTVIARLGGLEHYSWVFSAYLLTSTASVPVWGRLSDLKGRRRLYLIGVAIFLAGSALSGAAQSMLQRIGVRAIQGLGAGCIVPLALTIIGEIYTIEERARMQAIFSGMWGVASIVGPLVGGYITDAVSWRWVFYLNVPFGLGCALMVARSLPAGGAPAHGQEVDWPGAILLTAGITALLIGLSDAIGPRWPWFIVAAGSLGGLVVSYARTRHPILPLSLLRDRLVALTNVIVFLVGIAMFGAIAFVPLFIQGTRGSTATEAGQALTPLFLGWVTTSIIGVRLTLRIGYRVTAQVGVALVTASFVALTLAGRGANWTVLGTMTILGAGMGFAMMSMLLHVQRSVTRAELGLATSLNQFARSIGGAVGVAVMGAILAHGMSAAGGFRSAESLSSSAISLDPVSREALAAALRRVFGAGAIISGIAFLISLALPGQEGTGEVAPGAGETMLAAEMTTLEPEDEPVVLTDRT